MPLPDTVVWLYDPFAVQPIAYGGTGGRAPAPTLLAGLIGADAADVMVVLLAGLPADEVLEAPLPGTAATAADAPDAPVATDAPEAPGVPDAAAAAEAAAASDAAIAFDWAASLFAPCLPTTCADALCDEASCCFITSPIGIGWPSVSTTTCISTFFC